MPHLYIITGSNGAGKSTLGPTYFPEHVGSIFDGDHLYLQKRTDLWKSGLKIQKELNAQASDFVEATFNNLVDKAISEKADFAYEGHFSREESWLVPQRFKSEGYQLHMVFFGLESPDLSAERVLIRAKEGGHFVDALTLRENFYGNLNQLNRHIDWFSTLEIIDTSGTSHKILVLLENGNVMQSAAASTYPGWFTKHLPAVTAIINI